ncbi:MAG: hypothetical protein KKE73_01220 [Proteobacteria bacterium]|nr:hypothetical protein [Pseudomonadota bacterium]
MKGYLMCAALVLLFATAAFAAQDEESKLSVSAEAGGVGQADFDEREGGFSVVETDLSVTYDILRLAYGVRSYDWHDKPALPFGNGSDNPWDELHELELSAQDMGRINKQWSWFYHAAVSVAYEEEMDDSLGLFVAGGASYALNEAWAVQLGLGVTGHKTGWSVLPMLGVLWNQGAEQGFSARIGLPETELAYRFGPEWALRLVGEMEEDTWRLADDSTLLSKGYVQESGLSVGLFADWSPAQNLCLTFGPEVFFERKTTIFNSDGDKRNSYDSDVAAGASLKIGYSF